MSKAILRGVRLSAKKSRLIARQVQGMNGEYALASLEFTPNKAARIIYKVIASAIANGDFQPEEVVITSCRVDEGSVLKRFRPRARGTASKIRKPTAHIMVIVDKSTDAIDVKPKNKTKETVAKPKKTTTKAKENVAKKTTAKKTETTTKAKENVAKSKKEEQ